MGKNQNNRSHCQNSCDKFSRTEGIDLTYMESKMLHLFFDSLRTNLNNKDIRFS